MALRSPFDSIHNYRIHCFEAFQTERQYALAIDLKQYRGWALVTGASSGLGKAFAERCAAQGVNCVLVALEEDLLAALAGELEQQHGVQCKALALDLTRQDFLEAVVEATRDLDVGILINNAGFGAGGEFATRDPKKLEGLVRLNCLAPVLLTRHFLPAMLARERGAIVMVSSLMAFISGPHEAAYTASKAFDLHFGESLGGELRGTGVDVLTVCPAGMRTQFFVSEGALRQKDIDLLYKLSDPPERIAALALRNLGRRATVAPWVCWLVSYLVRFTPRAFVTRIARFIMTRILRYE